MVWPFEFDPELPGSNPMIANFFGFFQFLGFVNIYCVYSFELHDIKISKNLDGHLILVYDHDIKISKEFRQSGIIHL